MTMPTTDWVEARCDRCPQTWTVREGYTESGEFYREQAYCPDSIHHRQRKMKPLGVMPGTVQVKVARRLRNTD